MSQKNRAELERRRRKRRREKERQQAKQHARPEGPGEAAEPSRGRAEEQPQRETPATPAPNCGRGRGVLADQSSAVADARLAQKAMRKRWPVSDGMKSLLMRRLKGHLQKPEVCDDVAKLRWLGGMMLTAESQNQRDELADKPKGPVVEIHNNTNVQVNRIDGALEGLTDAQLETVIAFYERLSGSGETDPARLGPPAGTVEAGPAGVGATP